MTKQELYLAKLIGWALEDLMATSDEELRRESLEDGEDFDVIAARVKAGLQKVIHGRNMK